MAVFCPSSQIYTLSHCGHGKLVHIEDAGKQGMKPQLLRGRRGSICISNFMPKRHRSWALASEDAAKQSLKTPLLRDRRGSTRISNFMPNRHRSWARYACAFRKENEREVQLLMDKKQIQFIFQLHAVYAMKRLTTRTTAKVKSSINSIIIPLALKWQAQQKAFNPRKFQEESTSTEGTTNSVEDRWPPMVALQY